MSVQVDNARTTGVGAGRSARPRGTLGGLLGRSWVWLVQERADGPGPGERDRIARAMRLAPPH